MADKKKILIIEDEHPLANALAFKLTDGGFAADVAYDGVEGIEKLFSGKYDLLLLDLILPKKDGFMVLQEMRDKNIKVPVMVLTNLSQEEDLERVKALGASEYFVKSDIPLHEVIAKIRKFFST